MEYEEIIKKLGSFGRYQRRLMVITFIPVIFNSFGTPISNFLLGDQLHRCKIPKLENDTYEIQDDRHLQLINETIPVNSEGSYKQCVILVNGTEEKCSKWVYDKSVFTLTVNSQFDLVCDDELLRSHATSAYFFGFVTATIAMCPLGDIFGRRVILCLMVTLMFSVNMAMPFSPNAIVFAVLRFFDGFSGVAFYHCAFIIGMELVGPRERLITGTVILLVYAFGELLLLTFAYFIRDWRWLQLTLAIPMVLPVAYWWPRILPESPRWLISRGRADEALKILRHAAKVNKVKIPDLNKVIRTEDDGVGVILRELFHSKKIILRWIIVTCNWFVISFIYYGLTVNIGKLGGNLYVTFIISVVMEIIGYLLCFLLDKTGRKPMHLFLMYGAGIACLGSSFPILFGSTSLNWLGILLSMAGKLGISAAFGEIFIYTGELFPTVVRAFVMGICSTGARVGSTLSPYLYQMVDGKFGKALPLIIYAVTTFIVATLSIALPETKQRKLLEQVKDVEYEQTQKSKSTVAADVIKIDDIEKDNEDDTEPL